jgi:FtsZ-binding cell division protein ZapB
MTLDELQRENVYLKQRNAQLQADVVDISAERDRLVQELERVHGRRQARAADPLSGGQ